MTCTKTITLFVLSLSLALGGASVLADEPKAEDTSWFQCAKPGRVTVDKNPLNPLLYSPGAPSSFVPRTPVSGFKFPDGVVFTTDFPAGRIGGVTQTGPHEYEVVVRPENQPINLSPWYAFDVSAPEPRRILVVLRYKGVGYGIDEKTGKPPEAEHLYPPMVQWDSEKVWRRLTEDRVVPQQASKAARLLLDVKSKPMRIAAHEVAASSDVWAWVNGLVVHHGGAVRAWTVGTSLDGRPIPALVLGRQAAESKTVVVLGRAHPPEVTGWFALQAFVETLLTHADAAEFREHYRVLVFPLLNPDGVDLGHWRHNTAGIDLNRDWELGGQPETQAIQKALLPENHDKRAHVVFGIDFHSRKADLLYVQPQDWKPDNLTVSVPEWFCAVAKLHQDWQVMIQPIAHGRYTGQGWLAGEFGVQAVTWEVGYLTDRVAIQRRTETAALELAAQLVKKLK